MPKSEKLPTRSYWPSKSKKASAPDPPNKAAKKPPEPVQIVEPVTPVEPENDGPLLKPVLLMEGSEAATLNNLVCREILQPSGPLDPPSPTIPLLKNTVQAIATGADITPYKEHIERVAANQPEKSDLILTQLSQIDDERLPGLAEMQDNCERVIRQAARRKDLTVAEALTVWRLANQELASIRKTKEDGKRAVDSSVVDKFDTSRQTVQRDAASKWEFTSPQGREIIRKRLWEIKQATVTTVTVTQEPVNSGSQSSS